MACENQELVGSWQLESWLTKSEDGIIGLPFGSEPQGSLIYTPEGQVSVHLAATERPQMPTSLAGAMGTDLQRLSAYSTYVAYSGTYRLDGDMVTHRVTISLYPNWVGIELHRQVTLFDGRLVLKMPTPPIGSDPQPGNELHWVRQR